MLAAVQGVVKDNSIFIENDDLSPYNGKTVTVIINENSEPSGKQDKRKFFDAVGKIDIDSDSVEELRRASMI